MEITERRTETGWLSLKDLTFPSPEEDVRVLTRATLDNDELKRSLEYKVQDIPLLVSVRSDGTYYVCNGMRRSQLLAEIKGDCSKVLCVLYYGLSKSDEQELMIAAQVGIAPLSRLDEERLLEKGYPPAALGKSQAYGDLHGVPVYFDPRDFPYEPDFRRQKRPRHVSGPYVPLGSETKYIAFAELLELEAPEFVVLLFGESPEKKIKRYQTDRSIDETVVRTETGYALRYSKAARPVTVVMGKYEAWKIDHTRQYIEVNKLENVQLLDMNALDYIYSLSEVNEGKGLIYINGSGFPSIRPKRVELIRRYFPNSSIYAIVIDSPMVWKLGRILKRELVDIYGTNRKSLNFDEFAALYEKVSGLKLIPRWRKQTQAINVVLCKLEPTERR